MPYVYWPTFCHYCLMFNTYYMTRSLPCWHIICLGVTCLYLTYTEKLFCELFQMFLALLYYWYQHQSDVSSVGFGLVSLFNGISSFVGYLMTKPTTVVVLFNQQVIRGNKGFYTIPKGISLKVNIIVQLEFKLTNYIITVQHISHYTTEIPWYFHLHNWTVYKFSYIISLHNLFA